MDLHEATMGKSDAAILLRSGSTGVRRWNSLRKMGEPVNTRGEATAVGRGGGGKTGLYLADLGDAELSEAGLTRADLSGADLSEVDLSGANLRGASLCRASLYVARLREASLIGADLTGADLCGADLQKAGLARADLSEANLGAADLRNAVLGKATLTGAVVWTLPEWPTRLPSGFVLPEGVTCVRSLADLARGVAYTPSGIPFVEHRIVVARPVRELIAWLREEPKRLVQIGPQGLEDLILERLESKGVAATRIGNVNTPDCGVDIIARFREPFDFLMAVQIKSHDSWDRKTGSGKVRNFMGTERAGPFSFGLIVTNTGFTRNALEYMDSGRVATWLRRAAHGELCQWLAGNLLMKPTLDSVLPREIKLPGGPTVKIPDSSILDGSGRPVNLWVPGDP